LVLKGNICGMSPRDLISVHKVNYWRPAGQHPVCVCVCVCVHVHTCVCVT
jgi:hypothetical protein